jgi:3-methylfumaryl-CoA hydratase
MDEAALKVWIGRTEVEQDVATPGPLAGLAALLDHETSPWPQNAAPPLAHWLYFLPRARQSRLGPDGHPLRGPDGLLPPVDLPRRMWAGSRLAFPGPLTLGAELSRRSTVTDIQSKAGGSGRMVFVTVRHEVSANDAPCVVEDQDIVYREPPPPTDARPLRAPVPDQPPGPSMVSRTLTADSVQLFRFSALTFNSHRIHYDREYATTVEGYPGLVLHGPYLATLLMDHFLRNRPGRPVTGFRFRARSPLFDGAPFALHLADTAEGAELWALDDLGRIAVSATVSTA